MLHKADKDSKYLTESRMEGSRWLESSTRKTVATLQLNAETTNSLNTVERKSTTVISPIILLGAPKVERPNNSQTQKSYPESYAGHSDAHHRGSKLATDQHIIMPRPRPHLLESALATGVIESVRRLLQDDFDAMAQGEFEWLTELQEHGYSIHEIAQLLIDEKINSPWILLERKDFQRASMATNYHQPSCVHNRKNAKEDTRVDSTSSTSHRSHRSSLASNEETMLRLEELCGLAGLAPHYRNETPWYGSVNFDEESDGTLTASVSFKSSGAASVIDEQGLNYKPISHTHAQELEELNDTITSLRLLTLAIGYAQGEGICCDSFTCLFFSRIRLGHDVIKLCHIELSAIREFQLALDSLLVHTLTDVTNFEACEAVESCSRKIFPEFQHHLTITTSLTEVLDLASLTTQALCLAFCSYLRSHLGPLKLFFLDSALQTIRLFGSRNMTSGTPGLVLSLRKFTCFPGHVDDSCAGIHSRASHAAFGREVWLASVSL